MNPLWVLKPENDACIGISSSSFSFSFREGEIPILMESDRIESIPKSFQ